MRRPELQRVDVVTFAVAAAWDVGETATLGPATPAAFLLAAATCAGLLLARLRPLSAMAWVLGLTAVSDVAGTLTAEQIASGAMPLACSLPILYWTGRCAPSLERGLASGALAIGSLLAVARFDGLLGAAYGAAQLLITGVALAVCWAIGWAVRSHWLEALEARGASEEVRRTQAAAVRSAAAVERRQIARRIRRAVRVAGQRIGDEARAADAALDHDPQRAGAHLAAVEEATRETTAQLRRLLEVLRRPPGAASAATAGPSRHRRPGAAAIVAFAVFVLFGAVDAAHAPDRASGAAVLAAVGAGVGAAPLLVAGHRPIAAAVALVALYDVRLVAGLSEVTSLSSWSLHGAAAWLLAGALPRPRGLAAAFAVLAAYWVLLASGDGVLASDWVFTTLWIGLAAWCSAFVRRRRDIAAADRRAYAAELVRRADAIDAELAAQRRAVAREMHDLVGHALTLVAVHAGAARLRAARDPAAARAHLRTTLEAAEQVEQELEVLLHGDGPAGPSWRTLLEQADAPEHTEAALAALPASVGGVAYRIVQEALTNVRKHAPDVHAEVRAAVRDGELLLEVLNPATPRAASSEPSGGLGLLGMAERAQELDGTVEAGPRPDGGWAVRARLPLAPRQPTRDAA